MYNEQRKQLYLDEKRETASVSNNLMNLFNLSESKEEALGRDICEWTSDEIIQLYKYYSTSSIQTLIMLNNALSSYTNWCIGNNLVRDNQNHFDELKSIDLCNCIDLHKLKELLITREELLNAIAKLPNYSDQFIILGLFEGIKVQDDIMANVRLSDLNGNKLTLVNGTILTISDELQRIMNKANEEDTYQSMGSMEYVYDCVPDDTIIKLIVSKNRVSKSKDVIYIGARMRKALSYIDLPNMTMKNLIESGRLYYIKQTMEKENISFEEAAIETNHRNAHEKIFGRVQNAVTYIGTYGRLVLENSDT